MGLIGNRGVSSQMCLVSPSELLWHAMGTNGDVVRTAPFHMKIEP